MWSPEQWPCPNRRSMSPVPYSRSRRLLVIPSSSGLPRRPGPVNGQGKERPLGPIPRWELDAMVAADHVKSFSRSAKPMRNARVPGHPQPIQKRHASPLRRLLLLVASHS